LGGLKDKASESCGFSNLLQVAVPSVVHVQMLHSLSRHWSPIRFEMISESILTLQCGQALVGHRRDFWYDPEHRCLEPYLQKSSQLTLLFFQK